MTWKINNKEKVKEYNKNYREKMKELEKDLDEEGKQKKKEKIKHYRKTWYAKNKDEFAIISRAQHLKRYGLTEDSYNEIFEKQNGCCTICGKHQSEFKRKFDVDHCHETGQVRSLLCANCNKGLGLFQDNAEILKFAADYIQFHKAKTKHL